MILYLNFSSIHSQTLYWQTKQQWNMFFKFPIHVQFVETSLLLIHSMRPQNVLWNRIRFLCWVIVFITRSTENFYKMNACLRTLSVSQGLIVCLLLPLENDAFLIVYRNQWLVNSPSSPPTHSSPMESLFHERTRKEAKMLILSTVLCFSLFWFSSDKCIGVADGVGGWATCGVDPGEFSRKVCLHFYSVHF